MLLVVPWVTHFANPTGVSGIGYGKPLEFVGDADDCGA